MDDKTSEALGEDRFTMLLFAAFAAIALLLAAVGIYALMAFAVSQRVQEVGVRLALGSGKARVIWLSLRDASLLSITGLVLGLAGAAMIGRTMRSTLYEVGAIDIGGASFGRDRSAGDGVTGVLATRPRRAASIDPMRALRTE